MKWIIALVVLSQLATASTDRLINGTPVTSGEYEEVVRITTGSSGCTATVVGPRTIITAAHCAGTGQTARFTIKGTQYGARITRHPQYNDFTVENDIALGKTSKEITGVTPSTIGGTASVGVPITLLGYGCTRPGGGGGNDGILRKGDTVIVSLRGTDFGSRKSGGATLCPGDSGGPGFAFEGGNRLLLGINSTVTTDYVTSYNERTDLNSMKTFFQNFASSNSVEICGVNKDCLTSEPDPPTCTISASPSTIELGQSLTFNLQTQGEVTSARIGNSSVSFPSGSLTFTPTQTGPQSQTGTVTGPGGTNTCNVNYQVNGVSNPAPTCTLTAIPNQIELGQSLTLSIQTQGNANSATIDGHNVSIPQGSIFIQPAQQGQHIANASVTGPGGTGRCQASYSVGDSTSQPTPNLTVVPAQCGDTNLVGALNAKRVCLAVLKQGSGRGQALNEAIMITYNDGHDEIMPILHKHKVGNTAKVTFYANTTYKFNQSWKLDYREGEISYTNNIPTRITGKTIRGTPFSAILSQVREVKIRDLGELRHR